MIFSSKSLLIVVLRETSRSRINSVKISLYVRFPLITEEKMQTERSVLSKFQPKVIEDVKSESDVSSEESIH